MKNPSENRERLSNRGRLRLKIHEESYLKSINTEWLVAKVELVIDD